MSFAGADYRISKTMQDLFYNHNYAFLLQQIDVFNVKIDLHQSSCCHQSMLLTAHANTWVNLAHFSALLLSGSQLPEKFTCIKLKKILIL